MYVSVFCVSSSLFLFLLLVYLVLLVFVFVLLVFICSLTLALSLVCSSFRSFVRSFVQAAEFKIRRW